ncbi:MAG TPA: alpha/beta fold hydrolase [Ktedonobacterales bacterium]
MAETGTGYLELGDGKLYYEVAGEGETLVLGHAGFLDSRMWDPQWDAFTARYRVIRYDMRGYGKSDPASGPRNRRRDLAHLLDHLGVTRAALLGCSMSGQIMLDYALEHPEVVSALIMVTSAPSGFKMEGAPPPELLEMIAATQQGDTARTSELQLRLWIDGPYRQPEQVNPDVRRRAAEMNRIPVERNTWLLADTQPFELLDPPAISRLDTIDIPTLVMLGALDHPETVRAAGVLADSIKGAQQHTFAHSAHVPNMEEPEEFTQTVLNFLERAWEYLG